MCILMQFLGLVPRLRDANAPHLAAGRKESVWEMRYVVKCVAGCAGSGDVVEYAGCWFKVGDHELLRSVHVAHVGQEGGCAKKCSS